MGFEPLEDTLPLPQIVRTMKSITVPSDGSSISVDNNSASGNVDGGGQSSCKTRRQREGSRSPKQRKEICERSGRDRIWDEVDYLLSSLERTKAMLTNGVDWDRSEADWINERYELCKKQALHYVLCMNISEVLDAVTFPGERLSYLEIAKRVLTDCTEVELGEAICELGINPFERVYFKVEAKLPPIEQIEGILLSMLNANGYVLAGEFNERLDLKPNSTDYKLIKKQLSSSGWSWKSKKIQGKVVKVIQR